MTVSSSTKRNELLRNGRCTPRAHYRGFLSLSGQWEQEPSRAHGKKGARTRTLKWRPGMQKIYSRNSVSASMWAGNYSKTRLDGSRQTHRTTYPGHNSRLHANINPCPDGRVVNISKLCEPPTKHQRLFAFDLRSHLRPRPPMFSKTSNHSRAGQGPYGYRSI